MLEASAICRCDKPHAAVRHARSVVNNRGRSERQTSSGRRLNSVYNTCDDWSINQSIILFAHKIQMLFTWQYKSWTNKAIKLLQLPKKQNINQE